MRSKHPGQILVVTLIILLLVSITVVTITVTVAKNNRQVSNNIEYDTSYNYAESRLLSAVEALSDPKFELFDLLTTTGQNELGSDHCESISDEEYFCNYEEEQGARKTILRIEETNIVDAYDLSKDEYFDVILFKNEGDSGFRKSINLRWLGNSALELTLIYADSNGQLYNSIEVIEPDNSDTYNSSGSSTSGFLMDRPSLLGDGSEGIAINLGRVDTNKVPAESKFRYLRVRSIHRNSGTSIYIKAVDDDSLPNQVRRLTSFNYLKTDGESAVPNVVSQLPLSPVTPPLLGYGLSYHSVRMPVCGNGIVEGGEYCDDGDTLETGGCPSTCKCVGDVNGGFESEVIAGDYERKSGTDGGWEGDFTIIKTDKIEGQQAVSLSTVDGKGTLTKEFATRPNQFYMLQFKSTIVDNCGPMGLQYYLARFTGAKTIHGQTSIIGLYANDSVNGHTVLIQATDSLMTITFSSYGKGKEYCGPVLDDIDVACISTTGRKVLGDCARVTCSGDTPYAVGCDASFFGNTPKGCAQMSADGRSIFIKEGNVCDAGSLSAVVYCADKKALSFSWLNCRLRNKATVTYSC